MTNWMRQNLPTTKRIVYGTVGVVLAAQGAIALMQGRVSYSNYWGGKVFPARVRCGRDGRSRLQPRRASAASTRLALAAGHWLMPRGTGTDIAVTKLGS